MTNMSSPGFTVAPSWNNRFSMKPSTRARNSTLSMASMRPVKVSDGVTSMRVALTTVTVGGWAGARRGLGGLLVVAGGNAKRQQDGHAGANPRAATAVFTSNHRLPPVRRGRF